MPYIKFQIHTLQANVCPLRLIQLIQINKMEI